MEFAFASLANATLQRHASIHGIISYYEDVWNAFNEEQRIMLVDHELGHFGMEGTLFIKDHDISIAEHKFMIKEYGLEAPEYNWASEAIHKCLALRESPL